MSFFSWNKSATQSSPIRYTHTHVDVLFVVIHYNGCAYVRYDIGQGWVTMTQPTTRRDTVSLVLELLWHHFKEILETGE